MLTPPKHPEGPEDFDDVVALLEQLAGRCYFGDPGERLDHRVLEMLAQLPPEEAMQVLQEFEIRVTAGRSCSSSSALATFINAILEANDC